MDLSYLMVMANQPDILWTVIKPNTVIFSPQSSFSKKKELMTLGNPTFLQYTVKVLHSLISIKCKSLVQLLILF